MWLTAAEGHRHNGIAGSGVVLDGRNRTKYGIRVKDEYCRVEWLELKHFRRWSGSSAVQVKQAKIVDDDVSFSTVTYSDVDSDWYVKSFGNIRARPQWINPAERDFHLKSNSPCINAGTVERIDLPDTDYEGDPRIVEDLVDMGADEYVSDRYSRIN
jgi:hypothetical protein